MSKCDERFARQYRYEPPPGFPLASPSSDIVHHLSGPNRYACTQTSLRKLRSAVSTKKKLLKLLLSLRTRGCAAYTCTCVWTPWSVFQDGSIDVLGNWRQRAHVPASTKKDTRSACAGRCLDEVLEKDMQCSSQAKLKVTIIYHVWRLRQIWKVA